MYGLLLWIKCYFGLKKYGVCLLTCEYRTRTPFTVSFGCQCLIYLEIKCSWKISLWVILFWYRFKWSGGDAKVHRSRFSFGLDKSFLWHLRFCVPTPSILQCRKLGWKQGSHLNLCQSYNLRKSGVDVPARLFSSPSCTKKALLHFRTRFVLWGRAVKRRVEFDVIFSGAVVIVGGARWWIPVSPTVHPGFRVLGQRGSSSRRGLPRLRRRFSRRDRAARRLLLQRGPEQPAPPPHHRDSHRCAQQTLGSHPEGTGGNSSLSTCFKTMQNQDFSLLTKDIESRVFECGLRCTPRS